MDITQLRYFLKTASILNYTKTAEELFISRQSLRQGIQTLEADIGAPLFINQRNKITLTPLGKKLLQEGEPVLSAFEQMERTIKELALGDITLRLAYSVSLTTFLLDNLSCLLQEFLSQYPRLKLELIRSTNDEMDKLLSDRSVDCAIFMAMERPDFPYLVRPLHTFKLCLTFPSSLELAGKERLSLKDIDGSKTIGMGSLQTTFQPLLKDLTEQGITLHHQPVPEAIDAFYQIRHSPALGFDIDSPKTHPFHETCSRQLEDYEWHMYLAYHRGSQDLYQQQLADFLEERILLKYY